MSLSAIISRRAVVVTLATALSLAAISISTPVSAQEAINPDVVSKIRKEGLTRSQLPETLEYLTEVIGPRLTGSPGLVRANEWTRKTMADWGLTNAALEPWGPFGRGWTQERFSLQVTAPTAFPVIGIAKAWSTGFTGTVDVVVLEAGSEDDLKQYEGKLQGKAVLISPIREVPAHFAPEGVRWTDEQLAQMVNNSGTGRRAGITGTPGVTAGTPVATNDMTAEQRDRMQQMQRQRTMSGRILSFCKEQGAAVVLDAARGDGGTLFVQQATVPTKPNNAPAPRRDPNAPFNPTVTRRVQPWKKEAEKLMIPQIAVAVEHYNRIARMVKAGEPVKLAVESKVRFNGDDNSQVYNTIAEIEGSDLKDEVVLCGGHIDSWHGGTGATDDGAGVAVMMEAVRILKATGLKPRRTIRVALWSGEEQGIFGSGAYVKQHYGTKTEPKPEHAKVAGYYNIDNGTGKLRGIYAQGNEAVIPIFTEWFKPFADLGATTVTKRNTGGTDHLPFDSAGLPGFQFIQDEIEYDTRTHHSNMDVFDRIQLQDMKQAATIMAAFLYQTATRNEKLPRKP